MKKAYFLALLLLTVVASCNQKSKEKTTESQMKHDDSTMTPSPSSPSDKTKALYSCPMHPEVQGQKDATCSKCGMKLTEPIVSTQADKE